MRYKEEPKGCIRIKEFMQYFIARYLPIVDEDKDILKMLAMTPDRQIYAVECIVANSLREYERYCPLLIRVKSNRSIEDFEDNFDDYLEGKISEEQIELVPTVISRVTGSFGKITASYWQYQDARFNKGLNGAFVKAFFKYPYRFFTAPDGYISDRSVIYGLSKNSFSRPDIYQTFFDYEFIDTLYRNSKLIEFPSSGFPTMNYETLMESVKELRDEMIKDSLNIITTAGARNL